MSLGRTFSKSGSKLQSNSGTPHIPNHASPHRLALYTGAKIPAVGLGTWLSEPDKVRQAVLYSLQNGMLQLAWI